MSYVLQLVFRYGTLLEDIQSMACLVSMTSNRPSTIAAAMAYRELIELQESKQDAAKVGT
jgi:hypothetical protein